MKYILWFTIRGHQFKLTVRRILKMFKGYEISLTRTQELIKTKARTVFVKKRT
jgi:hypothetical protein